MARPLLTLMSASCKAQARSAGFVDDTETDISPLAEAGVRLVCGRIRAPTSIITMADTLDKADPNELAENGAAMSVLAYALANLPQDLPR